MKKKLFLIYLIILFLTITPVLASRLPTVSGDDNQWGTILNDFLSRIAGNNGTELNLTMVNGTNIYPNAINTTQIKDGTITTNDLGVNSVKDTQIDYSNITLADFTNDVGYYNSTYYGGIGNWTLDKSGYLKNTGGSATGIYSFNGGFSSGGLSIINGDLYGQELHFINMTGLNITSIATNGSLFPTITNSFDLGNGTYKWKNGIFSGVVNATTLNANLGWSYLQSIPSYVKDWNSTGLIKNWQVNINSANTSLYNWVVSQNYLTSYTETDPLAYNGTLAYNSSLANYYLAKIGRASCRERV